MGNVLTFDFGTTYFKVCLFDERAQLLERVRFATPLETPRHGRAELPVTAFKETVLAAAQEIASRSGGLSHVDRISFASQANTFTLLDKNTAPLIPFLLWSDDRAVALAPWANEFCTREELFSTTGIPTLSHQFLPVKLRWLQLFQPNVIAEARQLCSLADYFVWWLTGHRVTEAGLAGLTGLVDIHNLCYFDRALQHFGIPGEWLPEIVRAGTDVGTLRPQVANRLGVSHNCRLIAGCLDQYASAIGAGNVVPGVVSETTGTVLATVRFTTTPARKCRDGVFQGPAFSPDGYYEMVFSDISANLLERYRNALPDRPSFEELDAIAAEAPAGSGGLRLRTDAANRAGNDLFENRGKLHGRGHEVRAIFEAVARELRRQVALLCGSERPQIVRAAGGGASSNLWLTIKRELLNCPVERVDCVEPTSRGAAMLALKDRYRGLICEQ